MNLEYGMGLTANMAVPLINRVSNRMASASEMAMLPTSMAARAVEPPRPKPTRMVSSSDPMGQMIIEGGGDWEFGLHLAYAGLSKADIAKDFAGPSHAAIDSWTAPLSLMVNPPPVSFNLFNPKLKLKPGPRMEAGSGHGGWTASNARMPATSVSKSNVHTPKAASPSTANSGMGLGAIGFGTLAVGASAAAGGTMSYMTDGSFLQGAAGGAVMGAGMGFGLHRGMAKGLDTSWGQAGAKKFDGLLKGPATANLMNQMQTKTGRAIAFGSGALLGGYAFGGNKSLKRGFNQNRGNSIGR